MSGKYIKVFVDFEDVMLPLGDAERGRLFTAMLRYAGTGELPDLRGNERFAWPYAKQHIDRENETFEKFIQRQTENGRKGGRPRKPTGFSKNPNNPTVILKTQKSQDIKDIYIPSSLEDAIKEFKEFRAKVKKPMTDRAVSMLRTKLMNIGQDDETRIAIVQKSIYRGWTDVYPLKADSDAAAQPDRYANLRRLYEEAKDE